MNTFLKLSPEFFSDIVGSRLLFSVVAILLTILLFRVANKNKLNRFIETHIKWIAGVVFLSGVALYFIGFWDGGSSGNVITLLLRAILSSMEMFVSNSDLIEVKSSMHANGVYMMFFALTHFLAVFVSAIFIVPMIAYMLQSKRALRRTKKSKLYVFWGQSNNSLLLAADIKKSQPDDDYKIVFVELPYEDESAKLHLTHFFSGSLVKNEKMEKIRALDALLVNSRDALLSRGTDMTLKDVFREAGVDFLYKAITRDNIKEIKLFFLSDNCEQNVKNAAALISTTENSNSPVLKKRIDVYCHSPYNELCVTYSYTALSKRMTGKNNIGFNITDSARLAVVELKSNADYQPVNCIKVDTTTATVMEPFRALLIGFDETGEEVMKYLYEYSSLIGADGNKNPTKIFVTSEKTLETKNQLLMKYPSLRTSDEVVLVDDGVNTSEFKKWLASSSNNLNYIVVCCGSDAANISFTNNIYRIACRRRGENAGKLKIFVRSYSMENEDELHDIANYYNTYNKKSNIEIVVFGSKRKIFSYNSVVDQHTINDARLFYESYIKYTRYKEGWIDQYIKLSSTYSQHQELACMLNQNMSNWFHIATKKHLAGVDEDKEKLNRLLECLLSRQSMNNYRSRLEAATTPEERGKVVSEFCDYPSATEEEKTLLRNLAKCEFLRWKALMEMLGYIPDQQVTDENGLIKKDHANKRHSRVVSIDKIMQEPALRETIPYNYTVVDVSLVVAAQQMEMHDKSK